MGNMITRTWEHVTDPEHNPEPYGPVTFDPHLGFDGERKKRVMIATEQELRAAKIPQEKWDFCAHLLLELERCRADNWPWMWKCKVASHNVSHCYYEDYLLRMKEYERERRLLQRQKRIEEKAALAA